MLRQEFPDLQFQGNLRPSQAEVVAIAERKLSEGKRRLHIVAPPGAGKTVLGLYLWAHSVQRPALVLSPNSAIQAQWAARIRSFVPAGMDSSQLVSTAASAPSLLTSLTYQSVTLPGRDDSDLDLMATALWVERLIEQEHAESPEAANLWIDDLKRHSPDYFDRRLAAWRKQARDRMSLEGGSLGLLHTSSREALERLRDVGVGMVILDECHHLMGHWGRVLAAANEVLGDPVVLGLTATPPDREGQKPEDIRRYDDYFGPIDYEVPVPAVVRDGFLAPYQDLVWFVRPTPAELSFVADIDQNFRQLLDEFNRPSRVSDESRVLPLQEWISHVLENLQLPATTCANWKEFVRRDPGLAEAGPAFLLAMNHSLPGHVPHPSGLLGRFRVRKSPAELPLDLLKVVLDRYLRHGLRRSSHPDDQELYRQAVDRLRSLGIQVTETGSQACASPITRILGYTHSKISALIPILEVELEQLEDDLRAVVITDFEKSSATAADVSHVLDAEAGGAVAAFRQLVNHPVTNTLDPVLLTGSTILVDHDLAELFDSAARHWLSERQLHVQLQFQDENSFHVVKGTGADWCPRVYIEMVTQLFQDGITRCLVGTRGLLGEGWDANKVNVLIDLTTVATSMSVNQLRGRSIRLDPQQPLKLSNNWDVVCLASEFARGLDDYQRFCRKHQTIFGVTDDGAIEKGVGHVHAALTELKPELLHDSADAFNHEMLRRATDRAGARSRWKIGQGYTGSAVRTIEFPIADGTVGPDWFPDVPQKTTNWTTERLGSALGQCVLTTLIETGSISGKATLQCSVRDGNYVRICLRHAEAAEMDLFMDCLEELMSPFTRPRYVIPRFTRHVRRKRLTEWMPGVLGKFFEEQDRALVMYHAVPAALSKNRSLVESFQNAWNQQISSGDAIFAQQGVGEQLVRQVVQESQMPQTEPRRQDCFL
ncbi:MAG: DEAD/DEAH box helicase family protein [Planctomycetaceae bacterium]|nr:DEAD/DEAH box helicase family protein [Planctomycetaceae bacterium]